MESNEILRVNRISKRYGDISVFEHLDLSVKKGEVVVIVGPSGCGKSTFLRCLNGLEEIQEGEVLLDGERISQSPKEPFRFPSAVQYIYLNKDYIIHNNNLALLLPNRYIR